MGAEVSANGPCKQKPKTTTPKATKPKATKPKGCVCTKDIKPVCGKNGKSYPNACAAKCAGVEVTANGPCKQKPKTTTTKTTTPKATTPKGCVCTKEIKPVCGKNGKTYPNACVAKCAGVEVSANGPCKLKPKATTPKATTPKATTPKGCLCPAMMKPVCGKNGKTYSNACMAKCAGVQVTADGPCKQKPKG